jgi:hypothetical protein
MKKQFYFFFFITLQAFCTPTYNGFCSVPVADLLGGPINDFFKITPTDKAYTHLPYGERRGNCSCPRIAQLLFNQPVIIKRTRGKEVELEVPYLPYSYKNRLYTLYWTLASNITKLTDQNKSFVPVNNPDSFMLSKPITYKTLSYTAGTEFICKKKNTHNTLVHAYNPTTKKIDTLTLKNSWGLTIPKDFKGKQKLFVQLCKEWADTTHGFIPYVFGGISIGKPLQDSTYMAKKVTFTKGKASTFFTRPTENTPSQGIDCARIITRAAHMSGLPLYATNTTAFKQVLKPLQKGETAQDGDIVLWNGHVAVISDVEKGLFVEARSYDGGYGKVHEIPFGEQLKGITSTKKLVAAHFAKPRITRLNKDGSKSHFIYDLEILKLSSAV